MALTKLSDKKPPQMKAVVKEQELTEKNKGFLQNINAAEGVRQKQNNGISSDCVTYSLLREFTRTNPTLDRLDEEDVVSENPQTGFLHDLETKRWDTLELEAGHDQDLQNEQDEQERDCIQHEDPQVPTSVPFSDESIPELLLSEVMSLEGQIEKLESHQDLDPDQGSNIEKKIAEIKKHMGEMDNKFVQAGACNEAHELKEKLVVRIENFCKDMTLLNTKLGMYQVQEGKTDSQSPEEMAVEGREPLLPQAPPPPLVQNAPPRIAM
ncbi:Single-pass membrane and coiled-coil domain-containing protein 2, partial [Camelus dromedarius]